MFLVENELKNGALLSIEGDYIKGHTLEIVVFRLHKDKHGIMAERLWQVF